MGSPKHNRPLRATHPTTLPITSPSPLPFMYNFTYSYAVLASSSSSTLFFSTFEPSPPYRGIVNNHSQSSWILLLFSFSLNYWNPHQDLKCGSKMGFDAVISHAFLVLSILRQHLRSSYKPIWNLTPLYEAVATLMRLLDTQPYLCFIGWICGILILETAFNLCSINHRRELLKDKEGIIKHR